MVKGQLTRRQFLRGSGLIAGGAALGIFAFANGMRVDLLDYCDELVYGPLGYLEDHVDETGPGELTIDGKVYRFSSPAETSMFLRKKYSIIDHNIPDKPIERLLTSDAQLDCSSFLAVISAAHQQSPAYIWVQEKDRAHVAFLYNSDGGWGLAGSNGSFDMIQPSFNSPQGLFEHYIKRSRSEGIGFTHFSAGFVPAELYLPNQDIPEEFYFCPSSVRRILI